MAGIYLHIPFCKKACHYCNFHFSTSVKYKKEMVDAIGKELQNRVAYLENSSIETIYFGGGTPSLLSPSELNQLFETIYKNYDVIEHPEITLEANPDDLTPALVQELIVTPINRLSIGVQSFFEEDLRWMNRAHTANQATDCIRLAQDHGFTDLTIDLIYGMPTLSDDHWKQNLEAAFSFDIPHLSSYCLTVEPQTALDHFVKTGKVNAMPESDQIGQFEVLMDMTQQAGYDHYEISNFAKPGSYARHNSSYWKGKSYLGVGPSAHSYNGLQRRWNIAHNAQYLKKMESGETYFESENLTVDDRYNEYVMTGLRTIWGCDIKRIAAFGNKYKDHFINSARALISNGLMLEKDGTFTLTKNGKVQADGIAAALFSD